MTVHQLDGAKVLEVEFSPDCRVNLADDILMAQVEENIRRGLPQLRPYQPNGDTVVLVAGGPSLAQTQAELVKAVWRGGKVVAVNGAIQWCIDHHIKVSAAVVIDSREFSARFVETPVEDCTYLLASQCHPRAFELCRYRNVSIWHVLSLGEVEAEVIKKYYFGQCNPITLGTTVSMRTISLLRMLGYMKFEIFGLDSCYFGEAHHAYAQAENDGEPTVPIWVRPMGRDDLAQRFICSPWMAKQAEDFMELIKERGGMFQLNVHGPGLIATMIRIGASLETAMGD